MNTSNAYRTQPKSKTYEPFACRDCGCEVVWAVSKKGNTYLAQIVKWMSDCHSSSNGRTNERTFYPFHKCTPDAEYQRRYNEAMEAQQEQNATAIANGEIVKGQRVEVFKGRKIPIGTTGVIFWIASQPDQFDVVKAGIKTETGETVWVNSAHLKAI